MEFDTVVIQGKSYDRLDQEQYEVQESIPSIIKHLEAVIGKSCMIIETGVNLFAPSSQYGAKKCDIFIIDKDWKRFCVVEVERRHHTISHIREQIDVFEKADYNDQSLINNLAEKLAQKYPLDGNNSYELQIKALLAGEHDVLLLLDSDINISEKLKSLRHEFPKMKVCFWLKYQNKKEASATLTFRRFNGWLPYYSSEELAFCYPNTERNLMNLKNPSAVINYVGSIDKPILLKFKAGNTRWKIYNDGKEYFLFPMDGVAVSLTKKKKVKFKIILVRGGLEMVVV